MSSFRDVYKAYLKENVVIFGVTTGVIVGLIFFVGEAKAAPPSHGMVYEHVDPHGHPVFNRNTNTNTNANGNYNHNSNTNTSTSGSTSTSSAGSTSGASSDSGGNTQGTSITSTETTVIPAPPMQTPQSNPCPEHYVPVWYGQAVGNTIPTCIPIPKSQW